MSFDVDADFFIDDSMDFESEAYTEDEYFDAVFMDEMFEADPDFFRSFYRQ